jgi:hypothetical protein
VPSGAYRLILGIDGPVTIEFPGGELALVPGEAAALSADEPAVHVRTPGRVAVVRATA